MSGVGPSEWMWKEGGGYYTQRDEELRQRPLLPDPHCLRDQRLIHLFRRYGAVTIGSNVLEIGCGRSPWLPYLARIEGCIPVGIDIEPHAARLAQANLAGSGAEGVVLCRDAFDERANRDLLGQFDLVYSMGVMEHFDDVSDKLAVLARYLKKGARLLTTVPNLQGVNWALQRYANLDVLEAHVVYDRRTLALAHERAGLRTVAAGYVGFFDGHLSSTAGSPSNVSQDIHRWTCWALNMCCTAWARGLRGRLAPELSWAAPHVFYVGIPESL